MNSWRSRPPNRRCVCHFYYCPRLLIALATIFRRKLKNIDISQAFLQSSNLNDRDRLVIISPPTITLPWKREFPPYHVDIKLLPRPRMGFLSDRPLYGGRDAHMRRFIAFSTIIRKADYRQLQTDVCVFSRTRKRGGDIDGFLAVHVDDILFTGAPISLRGAERIIRTFRAGETDTLPPGKPVISSGRNLKLIIVAPFRSLIITILLNYRRSTPLTTRNMERSRTKLISAPRYGRLSDP